MNNSYTRDSLDNFKKNKQRVPRGGKRGSKKLSAASKPLLTEADKEKQLDLERRKASSYVSFASPFQVLSANVPTLLFPYRLPICSSFSSFLLYTLVYWLYGYIFFKKIGTSGNILGQT